MLPLAARGVPLPLTSTALLVSAAKRVGVPVPVADFVAVWTRHQFSGGLPREARRTIARSARGPAVCVRLRRWVARDERHGSVELRAFLSAEKGPKQCHHSFGRYPIQLELEPRLSIPVLLLDGSRVDGPSECCLKAFEGRQVGVVEADLEVTPTSALPVGMAGAFAVPEAGTPGDLRQGNGLAHERMFPCMAGRYTPEGD